MKVGKYKRRADMPCGMCHILFKLKSIAVGGGVLSFCTEFLSDRRHERCLMVLGVSGSQ